MSRQITLQRAAPVVTVTDGVYGGTMLVVASGGVDMSNAIFRVWRRPVNPATPNTTVDQFVGVCSVAELSSLGVDAPYTGESYFRTATTTITLPSQDATDTLWEEIKADVNTLVKALNAQATLGVSETYVATGV